MLTSGSISGELTNMDFSDAGAWVLNNGPAITASTATVTAVVAVLALVRATQDSAERSRPMVVAELRPAPRSSDAMEFVVRNYGPSLARDLRVSFEPPIPDPHDPSQSVTPFLKQRYASVIPALSPGQELSNIWWSGHGGAKELENFEPTPDRCKVSLQYRGVRKKVFRECYFIDVDLVKLTTYSVSSTDPGERVGQIAKAIDKIEVLLRARLPKG